MPGEESLKSRQMKPKYTPKLFLKSSIARVSYTVVQMVVAFFMMPFIIGKLGDRWYGIWVIVGSLTSYYYLLDFGLSSAVARFVAYAMSKGDSKDVNVIVNTSLGIFSILGLIILVCTLCISFFLTYFFNSPRDLNLARMALIIVGMELAFEFPYKAFAGIIQASLRYDLLTYSNVATLALGTILTIYFLSKGYGILALATISFGSSLLGNILFFLIAKRLFPDLQLKIGLMNKRKTKELFSYSVWSFIIQLGNNLRFKLDSFVIGYLLSSVSVTHYFIGARLVEYSTNLFYRATNFATPAFTAYYAKNDYSQIRSKLLFFNKLNSIIGMFGGGLAIVLGCALITLWMGIKYEDSYPVMVTLMFAMIIEFINNPATNVVYAFSRHEFLAKISVLEGLSNLILSIFLVKSFGIIGCAIGTAIPLVIFRLIIFPQYVCRLVDISIVKYYASYFRILALTLPLLGILFYVSKIILVSPSYFKLCLISIVAGLFYFPIVFLIGLKQNERITVLHLVPENLQRRICRLRTQ